MQLDDEFVGGIFKKNSFDKRIGKHHSPEMLTKDNRSTFKDMIDILGCFAALRIPFLVVV